jgi:hypothetical protein
MAQNVTIEFTDAQWALVLKHGGTAFQIPNTVEDGVSTPVTITSEIIAEKLKVFLERRITRRMYEAATTETF